VYTAVEVEAQKSVDNQLQSHTSNWHRADSRTWLLLETTPFLRHIFWI